MAKKVKNRKAKKGKIKSKSFDKGLIDNAFKYNKKNRLSYKEQLKNNIKFILESQNDSRCKSFIQRILSHPLCPIEFNYHYSTLDSFCEYPRIKFKNIETELVWFSTLFIKNKDYINKFLEQKKNLEITLLTKTGDEALIYVNNMIETFGYSFWLIEMKANILKELLELDTDEYLNEIKNNCKNDSVDFFLQELLRKSENKDKKDYLKNLIYTIDELRNTPNKNQNDYSDLISSYFTPIEFDKKRNILDRNISCFSDFSLVDQYLLFKEFVKDHILFDSTLKDKLNQIVKEITNSISDECFINLVADKIKISEIDQQFLEIQKYYTVGNYEKTSTLIKKLLESNVNSTAFIEIFARCNIYLNQSLESTFFEKIAKLYQDIILCSPDSIQNIEKIERISIKFHLCSWSIPLLFQLYNLLVENKTKYAIARKKIKLLGKYVTFFGLDGYNFSDFVKTLKINSSQIPQHRKLKYVDTNLYDVIEIEKLFEELGKETIIESDYYKLRAEYLIKNKRLSECITFVNNTFLKNKMLYLMLPISELVNLLETNQITEAELEIPILYDIYSKTVNADKDELKREAYENFIIKYDTHRPSIIFQDRNVLNLKEKYFLENICIPSIMDISPEFTNSKDLINERIEILNILTKLNGKDSIIEIERTKLLNEITLDKLHASINSCKIYVDVESLKSRSAHIYRSFYEIALKIIDSGEDSKKEFITLKDNDKIAHSDLMALSTKIFFQLVDDFVLNQHYGLDKYLSTDIRHGIFFSQLRSCFEKFYLITDEKEPDHYEDNTYWETKFPIYNQNFFNKLNKIFSDFSKNVDSILENATNWFKVKTKVDDDLIGPMFQYMSFTTNLSKIKNIIISKGDFETFFNNLIDLMWDLTKENIIEVKNKINEELKRDLFFEMEKLKNQIDDLRVANPLSELNKNISNCNSALLEELEIISQWLDVAGVTNEEYDLKSIIEASLTTFKSISRQKVIKINTSNLDPLNKYVFNYRITRAFISSLLTALDNAIKYAHSRNNKIDINIDNSINDSEIIITIKNKIPDISEFQRQEKINFLNKKLSHSDESLITKEGGTGLYKIFNLLRNASENFKFEIDIDKNNYFLAIMRYKYENLIN